MLDKLFPRRVDNSYRGHTLALWIFALVVLMKTGIGMGTIFNGRNAAISADGIPLDTFAPAGAQAFVAIFAAWGLAQATIGVMCAVVLVRYRALVPFMFSLLLAEHLARKLIFLVMPIARTTDAPGFFINLALVALMVVGLMLSLWARGRVAGSDVTGYSGTPLARKLGFLSAQHVAVVGAPDEYTALLDPLPEGIVFQRGANVDTDVAHVFVTRRDELARHLAALRPKLKPTAAVWVSWPKKASKVPSHGHRGRHS